MSSSSSTSPSISAFNAELLALVCMWLESIQHGSGDDVWKRLSPLFSTRVDASGDLQSGTNSVEQNHSNHSFSFLFGRDWTGRPKIRTLTDITHTLSPLPIDALSMMVNSLLRIPVVHGLPSKPSDNDAQQSLLSCGSTAYIPSLRYSSSFASLLNSSNIATVLGLRQVSHTLGVSKNRSSLHSVYSSVLASRFQLAMNCMGYLTPAYCITFDRTGTRIYTGSDDGLVKAWCAYSGRLIHTFRGHLLEITDIAVCQENIAIASASNDKYVRIWNHSSVCTAVLAHDSQVFRVLFSCVSDGPITRKHLFTASTDGIVRIFDAYRWHIPPICLHAMNLHRKLDDLLVWESIPTSSSVAPSTAPIISSHPQATQYPLIPPSLAGDSSSLTSSIPPPQASDNSLIPVIPNNGTVADTELHLEVLCMCFHPNSRWLAYGCNDRVIRIVDINDFRLICVLSGHNGEVTSMHFSKDGSQLLSFDDSGIAFVWEKVSDSVILDSKIGNCTIYVRVACLSANTTSISSSNAPTKITTISWSSNWEWIYSTCSDFAVRVWHTPMPGRADKAFKLYLRRKKQEARKIQKMSSAVLATAPPITPTPIAEALARLCHNASPAHVCFLHESIVPVCVNHPLIPNLFITAGHDGRVIFWNITSDEICVLRAWLLPNSKFLDASFANHGRIVSMVTEEGRVVIFSTSNLQDYARTPDEQFYFTDYRPLTQDQHGHVLDTESQVPPEMSPNAHLMITAAGTIMDPQPPELDFPDPPIRPHNLTLNSEVTDEKTSFANPMFSALPAISAYANSKLAKEAIEKHHLSNLCAAEERDYNLVLRRASQRSESDANILCVDETTRWKNMQFDLPSTFIHPADDNDVVELISSQKRGRRSQQRQPDTSTIDLTSADDDLEFAMILQQNEMEIQQLEAVQEAMDEDYVPFRDFDVEYVPRPTRSRRVSDWKDEEFVIDDDSVQSSSERENGFTSTEEIEGSVGSRERPPRNRENNTAKRKRTVFSESESDYLSDDATFRRRKSAGKRSKQAARRSTRKRVRIREDTNDHEDDIDSFVVDDSKEVEEIPQVETFDLMYITQPEEEEEATSDEDVSSNVAEEHRWLHSGIQSYPTYVPQMGDKVFFFQQGYVSTIQSKVILPGPSIAELEELSTRTRDSPSMETINNVPKVHECIVVNIQYMFTPEAQDYLPIDRARNYIKKTYFDHPSYFQQSVRETPEVDPNSVFDVHVEVAQSAISGRSLRPRKQKEKDSSHSNQQIDWPGLVNNLHSLEYPLSSTLLATSSIPSDAPLLVDPTTSLPPGITCRLTLLPLTSNMSSSPFRLCRRSVPTDYLTHSSDLSSLTNDGDPIVNDLSHSTQASQSNQQQYLNAIPQLDADLAAGDSSPNPILDSESRSVIPQLEIVDPSSSKISISDPNSTKLIVKIEKKMLSRRSFRYQVVSIPTFSATDLAMLDDNIKDEVPNQVPVLESIPSPNGITNGITNASHLPIPPFTLNYGNLLGACDYLVLSSHVRSSLQEHWKCGDYCRMYYPDEIRWYVGIVVDCHSNTCNAMHNLRPRRGHLRHHTVAPIDASTWCPADIFPNEELLNAASVDLPHISEISSAAEFVGAWNSLGIEWIGDAESNQFLAPSTQPNNSSSSSLTQVPESQTGSETLVRSSSRKKKGTTKASSKISFVSPWEIERLPVHIEQSFFSELKARNAASSKNGMSLDESGRDSSLPVLAPEMSPAITALNGPESMAPTNGAAPTVSHPPNILSNNNELSDMAFQRHAPTELEATACNEPLPTLHLYKGNLLSDLRWGYLSESTTKQLEGFLQSLMTTSEYQDFVYPVSIQAFCLYPFMVPYSMCLQWILGRLRRRYYRTWLSLAHDVHNIFTAACQFNHAGSAITRQAFQLRGHIFRFLVHIFSLSNHNSVNSASSSASSTSHSPISFSTSSDLVYLASLLAGYNSLPLQP